MPDLNGKHIKDTAGALLVSEGNPVWLFNIFSSLPRSTDATERGLLAVLYTIMYESGFYFMDGPHNGTVTYDIRLMRSLSDPNILMKQLKNEESKYITVFSHNLMYPNIFKVVSYTIKTNNCFTDPTLIVNFLLPKNNQIETFLVPVKKYVNLTSNKKQLTLERNLDLSLSFKNFLYSFKNSISEETYHPHHILSLPLHILQLLCCYCDIKSFFSFILTCKFLYETFSDDEAVWKYHSLKDHRGLTKTSNDTWKEFYRYQMSARKIIIKSHGIRTHDGTLLHNPCFGFSDELFFI